MARDRDVLAENIRISPFLFYSEDMQLIKDKKVLIYVMDTSDKREGDKDITNSSAIINLNMPELGQLTHINVPFKTLEEEERDDLKKVIPMNWAALCMHVVKNENTGVDELVIKRLNGLSLGKPGAV